MLYTDDSTGQDSRKIQTKIHGGPGASEDKMSQKNPSEVKQNTFPEIYGILAMSNSHICPAVMPTFLLKNVDAAVDNWSKKIERDCWIEYQAYFDESINWVESSIAKLLFILLNRAAGADTELEVVKLLRSEHISISEQIISMSNHSRIKNYWN